MTKVIALSTFTKWLDGLKDGATKAIIAARIDRLRIGLMGELSQSVTGSVSRESIRVRAGACTLRTIKGVLSFCWLVALKAHKSKILKRRKSWLEIYKVAR